ncbi:hypothetical protein GLE_5098 [Lysobacter enzymogenes]|uniref:Uncharacterized protein n=1 Tax=Lysobacter enzymogenes TaxID=69 RepID=A0A0S2DP48_LYSEN|nr:hypothetical protein GLE_5098 [Lysobacter enzymogenes]
MRAHSTSQTWQRSRVARVFRLVARFARAHTVSAFAARDARSPGERSTDVRNAPTHQEPR